MDARIEYQSKYIWNLYTHSSFGSLFTFVLLLRLVPTILAKRSSINSEGSFREAIWPFLAVGQCFGVMPVSGVKNHSISALQFEWKSLRTMYSVFVISTVVIYTSFLIWKTLIAQIEFNTACKNCKDKLKSECDWDQIILIHILTAFLLFYISNSIGFLSFFALGKKWPELMQLWERAESELPGFRTKRQKIIFIRKIRLLVFFILFMALSILLLLTKKENLLQPLWFYLIFSVEHSLSTFSMLYQVSLCFKDKDPVTELINLQTPSLHLFNDNNLNLICTKFVSVAATFVWSFLDAFIMAISIGIYTRFRLFNYELRHSSYEVVWVCYAFGWTNQFT